MAGTVSSIVRNRRKKLKLRGLFLPEDIYRPRERHTQRRFVPAAMNLTLVTTSRWAEPMPRPQRKGGGRIHRRSPSTSQLNYSNVKRKATARGRAK